MNQNISETGAAQALPVEESYKLEPLTPPAPRKSLRGFASMDPARQREIAQKGGRAAHLKGTAHEFTPDEARVAGRKGGQIVSQDRSHMALIGREGGQARGLRFKQQRELRLAH